MASVTFSVRCDRTQWGQAVGVLGSWNSWDKAHVSTLSTSSSTYPVWTTRLTLPSHLLNSPVHYKYVILSHERIHKWESDVPVNRIFTLTSGQVLHDTFSQIPSSTTPTVSAPRSSPASWTPSSKPLPAYSPDTLDPVDNSLVSLSHKHRSWRLRLIHVRSLLTDPDLASSLPFDVHNVSHLAALAVYLSFLSTGQLPCEEDGGHHRPNHHAREAAIIDNRLSTLVHHQAQSRATHPAYSHVLRKIPPLLPSYSPQFTVSVPLTRIRDIAHRSDIPRDLKLDIKHNLQNKLHRNAGPEDLHTSSRILDRITHGDYSGPFVEQFRIFHTELQAFFNASSLDDRLHYLQNSPRVGQQIAAIASELLGLKRRHGESLHQLRAITRLRTAISTSELLLVGLDDYHVADEDAQKLRLADIDLENYAFVQMAAEAQHCEQTSQHNFEWSRSLEGVGLAMEHMRLSHIRPEEAEATAAELTALTKMSEWSDRCTMLRVKAGVERATRFAQQFSDGVVEVYANRAKSLGSALGIEQHAIDMFGEAEIRSHVSFQMTRLSTRLSRMARKILGHSPWDALHTGHVRGRVVYAQDLGEVAQKIRGHDEDVIAIVRCADGDEDVPVNVVGVVNGKHLPHLSHLGVRARQANVVFVCAEDGGSFEEVVSKGLQGSVCELEVTTREGVKKFERIEGMDDMTEVKSEEEEEDLVKRVSEETLRFDKEDTKVVAIANVSKMSASSKCMFAGRLLQIANDSDGLFEAADGIAIPHGVFERERQELIEEYEALVRDYEESGGKEEKADTLRTFVEERFDATSVAEEVVKHFEEGDRVMIRSSANAEDLETMSGAGLYDSFANVAGKDVCSVAETIEKVWGSLWTRRAASSRRGYGVKHEQVSMAVLVQRMISSDLSFVALSQEPDGSSGDIVVEFAKGMGETLASGCVEGLPYRMRISRECWEVEEICLASFSDMLVASGDGEGLEREVVDYSRERMTTDIGWRREVARTVGQVVQMIEEALDGPQDVEGAVMPRDNGDFAVWVVQARAQTG